MLARERFLSCDMKGGRAGGQRGRERSSVELKLQTSSWCPRIKNKTRAKCEIEGIVNEIEMSRARSTFGTSPRD